MIWKVDSPKNGILTTQDVFITVRYMEDKNAELYEAALTNLSDDDIKTFFLYFAVPSNWNEGILLCEREIARRGLHVEDNERRIKL